MNRIVIIHADARVRSLYEAVLAGRGALVEGAADVGATHGALRAASVVVVQVHDGRRGLRSFASIAGMTDAAVVALDDDADPRRERWLLAHGASAVLVGPVSLRDLVDEVEALGQRWPSPPVAARLAGARVVHDSAEQRAAFDVRGQRRPLGRHLLLEADEVEIAVHSFPRGAGLRMVGSLSGPRSPVVARVEVRHQDGTAVTLTDALGRFEVEGVAPGAVELAVMASGWKLETTIELRGRA